ncbi:MAG: hypothetical protein K2L11_02035 [Muribaculaceae bacterium]|nr:hypothetical protein [Muribaculaceae bacterium]
MNKEKIYEKIELYFEAQLSAEEERRLLKVLLPLEGSDPVIDDALAVMLASRIPIPAAESAGKPFRLIFGIAASIALLIAIGIPLIRQAVSSRDSVMIAYVDGVKVEDHDEIMKIIDTQLNDIGESSELFAQTVTTDLDDIREALISDDL